jgi:hypothetical protein
MVTDESGAHSDMWLRTADGLYVSLLYVDVPDRTSIVSCADARGDAPVLALDDPEGQPAPGREVLPAAADPTDSSEVDAGSSALPDPASGSDAGREPRPEPEPERRPESDPGPGVEPRPVDEPASGPIVDPGVFPAPIVQDPRAVQPPSGGVGPVPVAEGVSVRREHQEYVPLPTTSRTRSRSAGPTTTVPTTTTPDRDTTAVG